MNNMYPLISSSKLQGINNSKTTTYPVVMGDINLVEQIVLRLDGLKKNQIGVSDTLYIISIIKFKSYWVILVPSDMQRGIIFPKNHFMKGFIKNNNILFYKLENKVRFQHTATMNHWTNTYGSSLHDYKLYHPNLTRNKGYIDYYQKAHRDYVVSFPKILVITKEK